MRRTLPAAALAAIVLIAAAPAQGATLRGRILGRPQVHGMHARVPVLLDDASVRRLGARSVEAILTVPACSGFRTATTGRTHADRTRLGDVVSARVHALSAGGAAAAKYLKIERRSGAPAFADLMARLVASTGGARQALDEVSRIADAERTGPQDPGQLRTYLLRVRYHLNLLIADLRRQADGIGKVIADVRGGRESDGARRDAAARSEEPLLDRLGKAGSAAGASANRLEDAVAGLDEFINSIGGLRGPSLPAGGTGVVVDLLATAEQVLHRLGGAGSIPGSPQLPGPLSGVPVRQDSSTSDLIFGVPAIVDFLQETCTLEPGDLILTGTPSGVGMALDPPQFLGSGDTVRIEIEALGAIEHRVA
jgi:hypothetical protein